MADYEITVRVRNARMLRKMREAGIATVAELARRSGVNDQSRIGELLGLKISALRTTGDFRPVVLRVCEVLRCLPEDIIPPQHLKAPLRNNTATIEADLGDVQGLMLSLRSSPQREIETSEAIEALAGALKHLTPRESAVLNMRYGLDDGVAKTREAIGDALGIGRTRAYQLEQSALRKLRHPTRSLKPAFETICREEG